MPGYARIRMRVSVCAYPGARAGERNPAAPRAPARLAPSASGRLWRAAPALWPSAVWPQAHSGEASAMAQWPIRPRAVRTGRERGRGRRRSGAAEFRRGHVRPTLIPPGRLLTSDCRGSARRQRISRHANAGSGQSAWAWSAAADSAFRAHWLQSGPKPLRSQWDWASALWPLGFGAWPWRLRPLPSPPLPSSSFSPRRTWIQVPRRRPRP